MRRAQLRRESIPDVNITRENQFLQIDKLGQRRQEHSFMKCQKEKTNKIKRIVDLLIWNDKWLHPIVPIHCPSCVLLDFPYLSF